MEYLANILSACSTVNKNQVLDHEFASEIQLNAFEFRNFRSTLETNQQQTLERIVNQWCAMLAKGRKIRIDGMDDKVYLDKDLLCLEHDNEFYPLRTISKVEFCKDIDDMMAGGAPYGLELTFTGPTGDISMHFNFEEDRYRLHFLITLRILRTRDPLLDMSDPSTHLEVIVEDEDEDEAQTYGQVIRAEHYTSDFYTTVVFSVSDLKLFQKLHSSSRHSYLEFFVKYPRQDRFLYAKSPTTHIPQNVLQVDDVTRRKKEHKSEAEEEEENQKEDIKRQVLGEDVPIAAMRFDLKNVKIKVPKIPHKIFGRLMAKDDFFPTAIGTFEFSVVKAHMANRMVNEEERKRAVNKKEKDLPATLRIPFHGCHKVLQQDGTEQYPKVGMVTIRLMGYVTETKKTTDGSPGKSDVDSPTANQPVANTDGDSNADVNKNPIRPLDDSEESSSIVSDESGSASEGP